VVDGPARYAGAEHDLVPLLIEHKDRFVLKPHNGNGGHDVHFGRWTSTADWCAVVRAAVAKRHWVVQELVESVRFPVDVVESSTGRSVRLGAPAVFGPLLMGFRPAGCLVRYDTADTGRMVTLGLESVLMNSATWARP
jgi:uncharacterized circularly permuted ATP-grasp superfamily protein